MANEATIEQENTQLIVFGEYLLTRIKSISNKERRDIDIRDIANDFIALQEIKPLITQ